MSDTILAFCDLCGEQFDLLPGEQRVCGKCQEEYGTDHYEETIKAREEANQSLFN